MKIETTRFGALEIPDERVLTFPEGLPGFEGRRFALIDREETKGLLQWLQSVSEPEVAVTILDPARLGLDYEPKPKDAELLPIRSEEEAAEPMAVRIVVRNAEEPGGAVFNLFAPILINFSKNLAMQVPLVGSGYNVREPWPPSSDQ